MDEIVWKTSPSLATAAYKANLSIPAQNTIDQYSYLFNKHRELLNLDDKDEAQTIYENLDPTVKDSLKSLFGKTDYMYQPGNWSLAKTAFDAIKSPFKLAFGTAVNYSNVLNTPGRIAQLKSQGPDLSNKIWNSGWDGSNMFDQSEMQRLDQNYGATVGMVARGLAEGKTPGEIIANQGLSNDELNKVIDLVFNQPETFEPILAQYERARLSPGRTLARNILGNRKTDNIFYRLAFNTLSGVSDLQYQMAIDPLTYVTFGVGSLARLGLTKAARLSKLASEGVNGVRKAFDLNPEVVQAWDNLGPLVKKYDEAKGNPVARQSILDNEILPITRGTQFDNDEALRLLALNRVYDAKSAKDFFMQMSDFSLFFGGRTHTIDRFAGNSVLFASRKREVKNKVLTTVSSFWNAASKNKPLTNAEKELFSSDFLDKTIALGAETSINNIDSLKQFVGTPSFELAQDSIKGFKGVVNRLRIHPGSRPINIVDGTVKDSLTGTKYVGEGIDTTLDVVESTAGLVMNKPLARLYAQMFKNLETPGDRVLALRGLYAYIMHRMGISAMEGGDVFMKNVLEDKFGNAPGMLTKEESFIGQEFLEAGVVSDKTRIAVSGPEALTQMGPLRQTVSGAPHAFQETPYIGQLPWDEIGKFVSGAFIKDKTGTKFERLKRLGATVNSKSVQGFNDNWTFFTLAPKLGIKSALDEQMFFLLYAPKEALWNYLVGAGRFGATAAAVLVGGPAKSVAFLRDKYKNYTGAISDEVRADIAARKVDKSEKLAILADEAIRKTDEKSVLKVVTDEQREDIFDLISTDPHAAENYTSTIGQTVGGGKFNASILNIDPTDSLSQRIQDSLGATIGNEFRVVDSNLKIRERAGAQFWGFIQRFSMNDFKRGKQVYYEPVEIFFKNNGLKTSEDIKNAVDASMLKVGFFPDANGVWTISDPRIASAFINGSADTVVKRKQGFTDAEIAQARVVNILADLKNSFNGGHDKVFNQALFSLITKKTTGLDGQSVKVKDVVRKLDFEEYLEASQNNLIEGPFRSQLQFAGSDPISSFAKGKQWFFERFDQQVTAWHRAPAHTAMYLAKRKVYRQAELDYVDNLLKNNPGYNKDWAITQAKARFAAIANQEATMELLQFIDNPAIRSQMAWSVRNVGRFYRATEDFIRRMYRLRKATLPVIYRMRLASLGLNGSGFIHEDASGNRYVVMPMDDFIFQAVNPVMNVLSGGKFAYKQPMFNEITLKLNYANPSLSADAATPTLSGPLAGASVWLFKAVVGSLPGTTGDVVADRIDNVLLGDIGDNLTLRRAMIPVFLDRSFRVLTSPEKDKQEITAIHQAIAYNQANGYGLSVDASPEEKYNYIKQIKISAHNIVALRNILGLTPLPFGVSVQESKDVPGYLKEVGIGAIRQEFFDLYENMAKAPNPRHDDLYEEALVAFIGQNPNRLVYTVSRNDKVRQVAFSKTDAVKDWTIRNQDFINKYGDVAYLAAPDTGDFSASSYAWFEAAGMIKSRDLESFLNEVQVAVDRQKYFDAEDEAFDAISREPDFRKQQIIKQATQNYRDALRISNPYLDRALQQGDFGISKQETMLTSLKQMLADPTAPIDDMTRRKLLSAVEITDDSMNTFNYQSNIGGPESVEYKKNYRNKALSDLRKLGAGDSSISQANKVIFEPMLRFKSRDVL